MGGRASKIVSAINRIVQANDKHQNQYEIALRTLLFDLLNVWKLNKCQELGKFNHFGEIQPLLGISIDTFRRQLGSARIEAVLGVPFGTISDYVMNVFKRFKSFQGFQSQNLEGIKLLKKCWAKSLEIAKSKGRTSPNKDDAEQAYLFFAQPPQRRVRSDREALKNKCRRLEVELENLKNGSSSYAAPEVFQQVNTLRTLADDAIAQRDKIWRKANLLKKENDRLKKIIEQCGLSVG